MKSRKAMNDTEVIQIILKIVSSDQGFTVSQVLSKTRKREIVQCRHFAMLFSKIFTNCSLQTIGYHIGGKDHATVLHGIKAINGIIETDKKVRQLYGILNNKIMMYFHGQEIKIYQCRICHSEKVYKKALVNLNTGDIILTDEDEMYYCANCKVNVPVRILTKKIVYNGIDYLEAVSNSL